MSLFHSPTSHLFGSHSPISVTGMALGIDDLSGLLDQPKPMLRYTSVFDARMDNTALTSGLASITGPVSSLVFLYNAPALHRPRVALP